MTKQKINTIINDYIYLDIYNLFIENLSNKNYEYNYYLSLLNDKNFLIKEYELFTIFLIEKLPKIINYDNLLLTKCFYYNYDKITEQQILSINYFINELIIINFKLQEIVEIDFI